MGGTAPATRPFSCHPQKHQGILKKRLGVSPQMPMCLCPNTEAFFSGTVKGAVAALLPPFS